MAKRRRPRERRRGRRQRPAEERPPPAPARPAGKTHGISWPGLIGGLAGIAPMAAIAVAALTNPPAAGRAFAVVPLLMAAIYAPAVWASLAPTELRLPILRGSAAASLVLAFSGSFLLGVVLLVLLLPATVLLWLASGGLGPRR